MTNGSGEFAYVVQRVLAPPNVVQPDTVTVEVVGEVRKQSYYKPDGTSPKGSSFVTLTFTAAGNTPTSQADIKIALPALN